MQQIPPRGLLRTRDVLALAAVSRSTLYRWLDAGTFPKPVRLGNTWAVRWHADDVDSWLQGLKAQLDGHC
jgi:prophage regulatory protein